MAVSSYLPFKLDFTQLNCTGVAGEDAVIIMCLRCLKRPDPSGFKSIHALLKENENVDKAPSNIDILKNIRGPQKSSDSTTP